jgi:2-hydroxychromene-2-carboxylate isomerase
VAERLEEGALPEPIRWQPISLGGLFKLNSRSSWARGAPEPREAGMAEVEARAREYELPPLRWPEPWPGNYLMAMRAATFASAAGRGREFALHAYRRTFVQGYDLSVPEHVLLAVGDAGLDPPEALRATQSDEIKLALREATEAAHGLGVFGVPTIAAAGELFWGDDRLSEAAARL